MKLPALLCLFASLSFFGCATRTPINLPPLNEAEYGPYASAGAAKVTGSVFLVTRGGDIKKGAARQVFLIPATSFVAARMTNADNYYTTFDWLGFSGTDKETIAKAWRHTRIAVADVEGKFVFSNIPAGKYVVESQLFWQYLNCGILGCRVTDTGAVLRQQIDVTDGAIADVQLTSVVNR